MTRFLVVVYFTDDCIGCADARHIIVEGKSLAEVYDGVDRSLANESWLRTVIGVDDDEPLDWVQLSGEHCFYVVPLRDVVAEPATSVLDRRHLRLVTG